MLTGGGSTAASAEGAESATTRATTEGTYGDFQYQVLVDGTAEITGYTGQAKELVIPSEVKGYKVTGIGEKAFYNHALLTSITIPDSVTSIGGDAFSGCSALASVTIGNGVKVIGTYTFANCKSLTSITIPDSLTSIEDRAFYGYTSLTDVYYTSTKEAWKQIKIDYSYGDNDALKNATIHYNSHDKGIFELDDKKAYMWFKRSLENNYPYAGHYVAQCHLAGAGVPESQEKVAFCYMHGVDTEKNAQKAFYWYRRAADMDSISDRGAFRLACYYYQGEVTERETNKASKWFEQAYRGGNQVAGFFLAEIFLV